MTPEMGMTGAAAQELSTPTGAVELAATLAERGIGLELAIRPGEVVAVLGANGAGKSTLLSLLSGLLRPDSGRIVVDGEVLVDTRCGVWVPPHRRKVVLLAQQALLFPHLTVAANVGFGPRSRGVPRRAAQATAQHWLTAVDAAEFADRKPAQLSGGQAQRVAIARALAAEPAVLLLDEPMAALDVEVAPALRHLLRRVLRSSRRTALLVTHDLIDALSLADRVVVLESGRIVEDGPTRTVLAEPRSAFTARIAGINLVSGINDGHHLVTPDGNRVIGRLDAACLPGEPAVAVFTPQSVAIHLATSTGSPRNHLSVVITELEPRGEIVRVHTAPVSGGSGLIADVTAVAVADLELRPGLPVQFAVKATEVSIHPAAGAAEGT